MCVKMSDSEIRRAVILYENGVTPEAIGGELGYSPRTVRRYLVAAGVYSEFDPARIPAGLAAMMREPVRTRRPRVYCEHALRRYLPEIVAAHEAGYGVRRIAKAIGVNADILREFLIEAGVEFHRPGGGYGLSPASRARITQFRADFAVRRVRQAARKARAAA